MKSIKYFFPILIILFSIQSYSQPASGTMTLNLLKDVNFPLQAFINFGPGFNVEDANLPRFMELTISANISQVELRGNMYWTPPNGNGGEIFNFISDPINLESGVPFIVSNEDFGEGPGKVGIKHGETNADLIKENAKKGKLSGTYEILMELYEVNGNISIAQVQDQLVFSDVTASFSIFEPAPVTIDGFTLQWDPIPGKADATYIVAITDQQISSYEDIASFSNPNIYIGSKQGEEIMSTTVGIGTEYPLDQAFVSGQTYYISVFAIVPVMFSGSEYYSADNNNLSITIPSQGSNSGGSSETGTSGGQSSGTRIDVDEDVANVKPLFSITEPVVGTSFEISNKLLNTSVTWEEVAEPGVTYNLIVSYVGISGSDAETNARATVLTETENMPGIVIERFNNIGTNTKNVNINLDNENVTQIDDSYIALGVYAKTEDNNDPGWRSTNVRFILLKEPTSDDLATGGNQQQQDQQQQNEEDVSFSAFQQLLNQSGVTIDSATDEDGNTYTQQDIQNLINQITTGTISGTLRVVTRSSSGGGN